VRSYLCFPSGYIREGRFSSKSQFKKALS